MEWVDSCQALGMWHSMQPLAESTGQVILIFFDDVCCCNSVVWTGGAESAV
jgi:hypothetical protein